MNMKLSRYVFILILILQHVAFAGDPPSSKAVGVFLATGVGARLPVGQFANSTSLGYGLMIDISYTDTDNLPLFIFSRIGYEQFPGSQDFYQESDYSNYSTTILPISLGVRYYFAPLVESAVLLIPVVEGSASYSYFQVLNEFKSDANKTNYKETLWKFGGNIGVGLSMFILEIMANYTYYESNQYFSINLNIRLPLYVNL
jgi:hypothetical protein